MNYLLQYNDNICKSKTNSRLTSFHVKGDDVVHIESRELSAGDIHDGADHTGSVRVTGRRLETLDGWFVPFLAACVEDEKAIACLPLCVFATKVYMYHI